MDKLIDTALSMKIFFTSAVSVITGFLGKILWDYSKDGRVEKASIYVKSSTCQHHRETCSLIGLKEKVYSLYTDLETFKAETFSHQKETDKRLSENNYDIRAMRSDITEIKEAQAHSNALLENIAEYIKK